MLYKNYTILLVLAAIVTDTEADANSDRSRAFVKPLQRVKRKVLPSFPSPPAASTTASLSSAVPGTTSPVLTPSLTTIDPGQLGIDVAEAKVKEIVKFVGSVVEPTGVKTEEDKLIVARAVEGYLQDVVAGIESDQWIIYRQGYIAVKIRLCAFVDNTTEFSAEFDDSSQPLTTSSTTESATTTDNNTTIGSSTKSPTTTLSSENLVNVIRIPDEVVKDLVGKSVIFAVVHYSKEVFMDNSSSCGEENNEDTTFMNSGVMSCFIMVDGRLTSLPVEVLFRHQKTITPRIDDVYREESSRLVVERQKVTKAQSICSYYDYNTRQWSQTGCVVDNTASTNDQTQCYCNHTTNFAVLMQVREFSVSETHVKALEIITMIGCTVSLVSLVATVVMFLWLETLKTDHNIIHFNLIIALIIAQTVFLSGVSATTYKVACMTVAILLHFSFLSVFTWMLMEGVHLYSKVVIVFGTESSKIKCYLLFGWGVPAVIVTIAAAVNPNGYGTLTGCWLDMKSGQIWAFVGPALLVLLVNIIVLIMVLRIVIVSTMTSTERKKESAYVRTAVKSSLFLLPILGITWLFGLFAVDDNSIVFQYFFAVFNSLQGLFVFMFQGIFNSEVRLSFKRKMEKRALEKGEIVTTSGGSYSRTFDRTGLSGDTMKTRITSTSSFNHATPCRKSVQSSLSNGDIVIEEETDIYPMDVERYVTHSRIDSIQQLGRCSTASSVQSVLPGAADDNQVVYDI